MVTRLHISPRKAPVRAHCRPTAYHCPRVSPRGVRASHAEATTWSPHGHHTAPLACTYGTCDAVRRQPRMKGRLASRISSNGVDANRASHAYALARRRCQQGLSRVRVGTASCDGVTGGLRTQMGRPTRPLARGRCPVGPGAGARLRAWITSRDGRGEGDNQVAPF